MYFLPNKNRLFRMRESLNMFTKVTWKKEGDRANTDIADKGGRGNADIG